MLLIEGMLIGVVIAMISDYAEKKDREAKAAFKAEQDKITYLSYDLTKL